MAIFRGVGGSGDSSDNSFLDAVTAQANAASASASAASTSASAASTSASSILNLTAATGAAGTEASYNASTGVLTVPKGDTGDVNNLTSAAVTGVLTGGTGISVASNGTITNDSPDQTVALTGAGGTSVSGTYPNFTITSSSTLTDAQIKTAYENNADTNAFTDADHTKLDGIEASADVTDTANVTSAGAAMLTGADFTGDVTTTGDVGIGTTSPDTLLHLSDNSGNAVIRLERNDTSIVSGNQIGAIEFEGQDANTGASGVRASIRAEGSASLGQTELVFSTATNNAPESERLRIDSSGNVLVGTTNADPAATSQNTVGTSIGGTGYLSMTRDDATVAFFNRKTNDGKIAEFRKDGTTVGSIGTASGDLYIGTGNTKLRFDNANDAVYAGGGDGTGTDNNTDLGKSDERFKDLYLSGDIAVGGTVDGRDISADGTKLDNLIKEHTFYDNLSHSSGGSKVLTTSFQLIGTSQRTLSGLGSKHINFSLDLIFYNVSNTNDGELKVGVTCPNPANETTLNLGTVQSVTSPTSYFKEWTLTGDVTKHLSQYCGLSKNNSSGGASMGGMFKYRYNPFIDKTVISTSNYMNPPSVGDTIYLHPFDWETENTTLDGQGFYMDGTTNSTLTVRRDFKQSLGYFTSSVNVNIKAREVSTADNIAIDAYRGSIVQIGN